MRTYLLLIISSCLSATTLGASAPLNFPEVAVNTGIEGACFAAARDLDPDPSTCDVLIQRADTGAQTLAATHNNRGLILGAMGLQEEALVDFETALELAPGLGAAQVNRASTLFQLARYPEALTAYDEALTTMTTEQHVALFNRALVHRALGNVEAAGLDLAAARRLAERLNSPQAPR
jgi:tetratricopeptide (TPR) repeat protein